MFNDDLVEIEERIYWLRQKLATLSIQRECRLDSGFGFRGGRPDPNAEAPWVMLDLGRTVRIDRLFLVPAQLEFGLTSDLFPKRFLIEADDDPGFAQPRLIMNHAAASYPRTEGRPVSVHGRGVEGRYVRLTVLEGTPFGYEDAYALSELLVVSGDEPVSFGAPVSSSWQDRVGGFWDSCFLTDGRMPLGPWESGTWSPTPGFSAPAELVPHERPLELVIDLGRDYQLDRVHVLPLECRGMPGVGILPKRFVIGATAEDSDEMQVIHEQSSRVPRQIEVCPQVFPAGGVRARYVRMSCIQPWSYGDRVCHGLAEIEVYSGGVNVALGAEVRAWQGGVPLEDGAAAVADGFGSTRRSLPVQTWMEQLAERALIEAELDNLVPVRQQMSKESELHATWIAAMGLGLSFLIPVAIIERRRLMSREQVDVLRRRIASDLHDDIGSNLGSISMIARVARRELAKLRGAERVIEDIEELESIARESSLAMRDIVWLIERKHDTIGDLVNRLRETASRLLRDHKYKIECDCKSGTSRLCLDAKRHLFLFCKEAMHNVVKHARATRFNIRLEDDDGWLVVEASDDGVGLGEADSSRKATLQKLHERARVLAGVLDMTSDEGRGTTIVLRIPRSVLQSRIPI